MADYAAELLGGGGAAQPQKDYAGELLGGKTYEPSVMTPVEQESNGAGFGAMVKSAMVDDPKTKIDIYAKSRFPKEKDAIDRYGVIGGEIVYLDTDGKIKKESPSGVSGFAKELGANIIGQAPSVIGGTVGAIAGAPAGPLAAAGGAALGSAGGKGISQVIANTLFDEPQSPGGNAAGMATEGAMGAVPTFIGSKLAQVIGNRSVTRDIAKLDRPAAEELIRKGQNIGVDLNVAQATNLPSLKGRFEVLGRLEPSMDIIDASRVKQGEQAGAAVGNFLDTLSGVGSTRAAGEGSRTGAKEVLERMATDRATAAKPWYDKALQKPVNVADEQLSKLTDTPAFQAAFERGKRIAANEGVDLGDAANNMRALHYVKLGLDDLIQSGGTEGVGGTERRAIVGVQKRLLSFMDAASPDYARARSIFGHYMPSYGMEKEGLVGQLADLSNLDLNTAARQVFGPQTAPEDVRKLRSTFFRYDQGEKWNGLLRSYLQDTFEKAGQEFKSGAGGVKGQASSWRAALFGNARQYANIQAAMTEPQRAVMGEMMDVFEAMGRVTGVGGSPTMPLQEAAKQLRGDASGIVPKVLAPREAIKDWLIEARMGKHAEEMARVMTDPKGIDKLKQLREMSLMDRRYMSAFSSLFGVGKNSDQTPEDAPIPRAASRLQRADPAFAAKVEALRQQTEQP